jgi:hypothetical protein
MNAVVPSVEDPGAVPQAGLDLPAEAGESEAPAPQAVAMQIEPIAAEPVAPPAGIAETETLPVKAPVQHAKTPVKEVAAPAAIMPPPRAVEPPAAAKATEVPLDVPALKARLRDTPAIGVLAKLSLRSQVDELLESFRAHYAGSQKPSFAALRKPYDSLVTKVLDLLQDGDPPLARSIANSREVIWGILVDRDKFNAVK